ncbi:putative serpin-like protein MM_2675 [Araneus ventricosus]|uniref:Putative serpin-like protein MM_2675 n=1 Tax=Araneus ventricosus TaxID=182803 RepID=A0A4Y1ZRX1_ARAVE|nr:putative serpin-like protein MM_2675 [Araneus ventricosus]
MMRMTNLLNLHRDQHHSIVELPFKGRNVSMIILLPNTLDGIGELLESFTPEFLEDQILKMTPADVDIALPKFKINFGADVTENLVELGAGTLFHPEKVDLSEMIRRETVTFGEVLHKTEISVTESGVEAAAATAIFRFKSFPPLMEMPDFHADHPFLFVIYERRIKMILFVGRAMEL